MENSTLLQSNLFSVKENYILSCTETGKLRKMMALSATERRKRELNNMHLMEGMTFTDSNGFPMLGAYTGLVDVLLVPFSQKKQFCPQTTGIHFFEDDYKFSYAMWERLDQSMYGLKDYKLVFCPDQSLYIEEDEMAFLNKQSIYRSRFAGACMQLRGYDLIPTASWGGADSFEYCFESLPHNSVIGVCGTGVESCQKAIQLWEYGLRELEARLNPKLIVIYGNERKVIGLSTPTMFIPPYVQSKLKGRKEIA